MRHSGSGASGQAGPPLLSVELRRPAAVAAVLCAAVTLLLGVAVHHHASADGLDRTIDPWLHQSIGRHRGILHLVSLLGTPVAVAVLAVVLVVACLVARRWRAAVLVATAVLAASVLTEFLLKPLVGRRMGVGTGSFPSGHAVGMFALAVTVCVLLAQTPRLEARLRRLLSLCALLVATAVSVAMVAMNHHYFTDAIGGAAVGTAMVLLTALALDWLAAKRWAPHGPPRQALISHGHADTSAGSYVSPAEDACPRQAEVGSPGRRAASTREASQWQTR